MTANQREVLLALNVREEEWPDGPLLAEHGILSEEVAAVCGFSTRSTATLLSSCRRRGWTRSLHDYGSTGWLLTAKGRYDLARLAPSSREAVA